MLFLLNTCFLKRSSMLRLLDLTDWRNPRSPDWIKLVSDSIFRNIIISYGSHSNVVLSIKVMKRWWSLIPISKECVCWNSNLSILVPFADLKRSSHQRCSMKKGALRNFTRSSEKYLRQSLLFNKVTGLRSSILLKKRLRHNCFLWILWNF